MLREEATKLGLEHVEGGVEEARVKVGCGGGACELRERLCKVGDEARVGEAALDASAQCRPQGREGVEEGDWLGVPAAGRRRHEKEDGEKR